MYAKLLFAAALLFILPLGYTLQISEIMYNPSGSDTGNEWIEIYNNDSDSYNLTGWKLRTGSTDHTLNVPPANGGQGGMQVAQGAYVLIVQDAATFLADHPLYVGTVIDSSWTDLSNTANSTVVLKNSTTVFSNITFSPTAAEGNTVCLLNSSFQECAPTPGTLNMVFNSSTFPNNSAANSTTNSTNTNLPANTSFSFNITDARISVNAGNGHVNSNYSLFLIEIDNKSCSSLENVTINYNITPDISNSFTAEVGCSYLAGAWTPQLPGNYTICASVTAVNETNYTNNAACKTVNVISVSAPANCNMSISIAANSIYSGTVSYNIIVNDTVCAKENSFQVEYWIEDLFGNYVRDKTNTTQSMICSKSLDRQWTPPIIAGSEAYKIRANLSASCGISGRSDEKLIVVKGQNAAASNRTEQPPAQASSRIELVSYPQDIFVDEPFDVVVKTNASGVSLYSYVNNGNTPVSQGFNGSSWKGSWDANKIDVENESIVVLRSRIENGTVPGIYSLKVKAKGSVEDEIKRQINVTAKPEIKIKKFNNTAYISSNCEGCDMLIIGSEMEKTFRNSYTLENASGTFRIFLMKNSRIISADIVNLSKLPTANKTVSVTGFSVKKNNNIEKYILILNIFSIIKKRMI